MERYFILDKFNTWYDWHLLVTDKSVAPAEPKTNLVDIDGMSGSLDLSETLTGEVVYKDRVVSAKFWTDYGKRSDRVSLLQDIIIALHGRKIKIVEPDDPDHYFYGRVVVTPGVNNLAYMEFTIEAVCEPWKYAHENTVRTIVMNKTVTGVVIHNHGRKTVCPVIMVDGQVNIKSGDIDATISSGMYTISDLKLYHGVNTIGVSGTGTVSFIYQEADL